MVIAGLGAHELVVLAIGAVLLDLAVQGHQVLSQREIYALRADARARINTVFMSTVFIGGAICSAIAGWLYEHHGWAAVSAFARLPARRRPGDLGLRPDRGRTSRAAPPRHGIGLGATVRAGW